MMVHMNMNFIVCIIAGDQHGAKWPESGAFFNSANVIDGSKCRFLEIDIKTYGIPNYGMTKVIKTVINWGLNGNLIQIWN